MFSEGQKNCPPKGRSIYTSQQFKYCNCSSNHSCGNSASRGKQLQVLAGDGSPSKSSIDLIGLETESEWNYIVRSCIIRNTTQNQGSSIISCIEVQLAMAQYDCHPPGVLKCSYQLRQHNSNMLQQLFIISCIEVQLALAAIQPQPVFHPVCFVVVLFDVLLLFCLMCMLLPAATPPLAAAAPPSHIKFDV